MKKKTKKPVSMLTRIRAKAYTKFVDAKKVKAARERAGLTKTQVAKALGWKPQQWGDFENARHPNPRIGTLLSVCKVLGCEIFDVLKA